MTPADEDHELLEFLGSCSDASMGDFSLAYLDRDVQLRRDLHALLDKIIKNREKLAVGQFFRRNRRQIADQLARPQLSPKSVHDEPPLRTGTGDKK